MTQRGTKKKTAANKAAKSASKKPVQKTAKKAGNSPTARGASGGTAPELAELRARIDGIDDRLLELLSERASIARQIGCAKRNGNHVVHVPERERAILTRLLEKNPGPLGKQAVEGIFREIFSASLALQRPLRIAFFGPEGTNTHQAALKHFGHQHELLAEETIPEVFTAVEQGRADYGVVPVENSTEGAVNITFDRLLSSSASICAEVVVEIHHHLLRAPDAPDRPPLKIYSHPQALAQCRDWILSHYPEAETASSSSTAKAAERARREKSAAAIANELAAARFGLKIVAERIEDLSENRTRFLVLGRQKTRPSGTDKTSLALSVKDEPGVLSKILEPLAKRKVNLTKIESRPARERPWEYIFFVDLAGHLDDRALAAALPEIEKRCRFVRVLGSYPRAV